MDVKKIRCDLHQIPELGRREYKTKEYILNQVKDFNCEIYTPTPTSVVLFFNQNKNKTICFRADMDALPIEEENDVKYRSKHTGCMHACGHDGHMAMLLGFASWANENLDALAHNVVCLFQPSEEDDAGAMDIINSKILDELKVDEMYGFHLWPNLEENHIYTMPNGMLATSAEVDITIHGKGVHAANRACGIDALEIASKLILEFYKEMKEFQEPHLINFGHMASGTVRNSVASFAKLEATMRAFDDPSFEYMKTSLLTLIHTLEEEYHTTIDIKINAAYPSVINDVNLVERYKDILGYSILDKPFLQAEDFGCYTRKYKCLFLLLGCGTNHLLHTSTFDFNMDILHTGVSVYQKIATSK